MLHALVPDTAHQNGRLGRTLSGVGVNQLEFVQPAAFEALIDNRIRHHPGIGIIPVPAEIRGRVGICPGYLATAAGHSQGDQEYRGLHTIGHGGSSWGFRTELIRFVEPALSIAISCNMGNVNPQDLASRVAEHFLSSQLEAKSGEESIAAEEQVVEKEVTPPTLTSDQLAEYTGAFFSPELDATYRFSVVDDSLAVRIEQEPPLSVAAVAADQFEIIFQPPGWTGPGTIRLEFDRGRGGLVIGFGLSLGAEEGIIFERR